MKKLMLHCDENKLVIDFIHEKSFIVLGWYMAHRIGRNEADEILPTKHTGRSNFGKPYDE